MPATIVLVHGSFHGGWCWTKVVAGLLDAGRAVVAVDLPGHAAGTTEPPTDLHGDAAHVREAIDAIRGPVVLVGHSYGGAVITEAAFGHPGVAHLVYLAAIMPDAGESITTAVPPGGSTPPISQPGAELIKPDADGLTLRLSPELVPRLYYHDCSAADVDFALQRLSPQTIASFTQPVSGAAWRTIPATYIVCADDRALPPESQRAYATRAADVVTLPCSHSGFFACPESIVDILRYAANGESRP